MKENQFTTLERSILKAKGLTDEQFTALQELGVVQKSDLEQIGTVVTFLELLPELDLSVATRILEWALPKSATEMTFSKVTPTNITVDGSDAVFCKSCNHKQPKDYTPGDLCVNCGRQAEPIEQCFWCGMSGPGKFCRGCAAVFVRTPDLPLALLLRRDGLSKDEIPKRLSEATDEEKDQLWGRVRRARI